jgi:hypothetical protein
MFIGVGICILNTNSLKRGLWFLRGTQGSRSVDGEKLYRALDSASRRYSQSSQEINQAFFHGLLTGYAVGLKHK